MSFLNLLPDLVVGFLGQLFLLDLLFELLQFRLEVVLVAHLLLDGPHLLIQVVVLLGLLHLLLDPFLEALFNLEDLDFCSMKP